MDISSPETWRWIWAIAVVVFAIGEMITPGMFFMLPFAIGALIAAVASFFGAPVGLGWLLFAVVSVASFAVLLPLGRRLNERPTDIGVGVKRYEGMRGVVVEAIDPGPSGAGQVRIERELWRASAVDAQGISEGAEVEVVSVEGTRLVVRQVGGASVAGSGESAKQGG